jgi:microbial collagenase
MALAPLSGCLEEIGDESQEEESVAACSGAGINNPECEISAVEISSEGMMIPLGLSSNNNSVEHGEQHAHGELRESGGYSVSTIAYDTTNHPELSSITNLEYDTGTGLLYGTAHDDVDSESVFVSIDPSNGLVSSIGTMPSGEDVAYDGSSTFGGSDYFDSMQDESTGEFSLVHVSLAGDSVMTASDPASSRFSFEDYPSGPQGSGSPPLTSVCDSTDLVGKTSSDLIAYLKSSTSQCLSYIWTPDNNVENAMTDANIQAIASEIVALEENFVGTNADGLMQLFLFIRVAYYHVFYGQIPQLSSISDTSTEDAIDAIANNVHILDDNSEAGSITYQLVNTADAANLAHKIIPLHSEILDTLAVASRLDDSYQAYAVWGTLLSIARQVDHPLYHSDNGMPDIVTSMSNLAQDSNNDLIQNNHEWVVVNAIWAFWRFPYTSNPSYYSDGFLALIDAQNTHYVSTTTFTISFLQVVKVLDDYYDCTDPAVMYCVSDIKPILENQLFPNTYGFDDGSLVVRTPLLLSEIQTLYHASKEVISQFNRVTETITPIDDDPNGALTMIIYGTKSDYVNYHNFLYGLNTNNGGIYIEQWGTFFTYQRTPQESSYTLEDLFRHEYVHYLAGRYLIGGFWGDSGSIYDDNRMIWFDEGFAEFLVWSTASDGVRARATLVNMIDQDGSNRMTISEIVSATYSTGWKFYRYGGLFFHYLYANDIGTLQELMKYAHESDISSFDTLVSNLTTDVAMEADFQAYLTHLIGIANSLDDPTTTFPDLTQLDTNSIADIESAFRNTRLGAQVDCTLSALSINPRFSCRGYLTTSLQTSPPDAEDTWILFDENLDEIINELTSVSTLNNFEHVTCRFARQTVSDYNGDYYTISDFNCDGPLASGAHTRSPPLQQVEADFASTRLGTITICSEVVANEIECDSSISTIAYPPGTTQSTMQSDFDYSIVELENQVYSISPSYYRDFDCYSNNDEVVQTNSNNDVYLLGSVHCTAIIA